MIAALVSMLIAQAPPAQNADLSCSAWFSDGARTGYVNLWVGHDYQPRTMKLLLRDPDGWTRATVSFDPNTRKLPGSLSNIFFLVRFEQKPAFPLELKAYADGQLRWQKTITTPFMPPLAGGAAAPGSGTVDYLGGADDGLPVPTPRELQIMVSDAKGRAVGALRYPVLDDATQAAVSEAMEKLEADYSAHACSPPPPPID